MDTTNNTSARATRLADVERTITIDGAEYLVRGTQSCWDKGVRTFRAWKRSDFNGNHQTVSSLGKGEGHYGLVGTEIDRELYEHLPAGSAERLAAVRQKLTDRAFEARRVIFTAFPEIRGCQAEVAFLGEYEVASAAEVA